MNSYTRYLVEFRYNGRRYAEEVLCNSSFDARKLVEQKYPGASILFVTKCN